MGLTGLRPKQRQCGRRPPKNRWNVGGDMIVRNDARPTAEHRITPLRIEKLGCVRLDIETDDILVSSYRSGPASLGEPLLPFGAEVSIRRVLTPAATPDGAPCGPLLTVDHWTHPKPSVLMAGRRASGGATRVKTVVTAMPRNRREASAAPPTCRVARTCELMQLAWGPPLLM